jgi:hypothetical protein
MSGINGLTDNDTSRHMEEGYDAFERREPELWHEATPGQLLHHKARRLIRLA